MSQPFLGEVKILSFNFAPKGWAECNGQLLPISQNQALFSILGTAYGGDGRTTFGLPDLRGRVPVHTGGSIGAILGQKGGAESHTLTMSEMPAHNHFVNASSTQGDMNTVQGNILAQEVGQPYGAFASLTTLPPSSVTNTGGSQPHENRSPVLALVFAIALQGIFPSRN